MSADFDAGSIEGTLDLDTSPFYTALRRAQKDAQQFESRNETKPKLGLDTKEFDDNIRDSRAALRLLDRQNANPNVGLDGTAKTLAQISLIERRLKALRGAGAHVPITASGGGVDSQGRGGSSGGGSSGGGDGKDQVGPFLSGGSGGGGGLEGILGVLGSPLAGLGVLAGSTLPPITGVALGGLMGLVGQFGAAALGAGTLMAAINGVGEALTAVNKAAIAPTVENLDAAEKAMAGITPSARLFVREFQELRPVLGDISDAAARGWFPGLTDALGSLERIAPEIEDIFSSVSQTGGDLIARIGGWAESPEGRAFLAFVSRTAPDALDAFGTAAGNAIVGVLKVFEAFEPLQGEFNDWLVGEAREFVQWAEDLKVSPTFQKFLDYIRESGPQVAASLSALGGALLAIGEALAPLGGPGLLIIEKFSDAIAAIARSDLGTPILGGIAALSAYNAVLKTTVALQAAAGFTGAAGAAGAGGAAAAAYAGAGKRRAPGLPLFFGPLGSGGAGAGRHRGAGRFGKLGSLAKVGGPLAVLAIADEMLGLSPPQLTDVRMDQFADSSLQANLLSVARGGTRQGGLENFEEDRMLASGELALREHGEQGKADAAARIKAIDAALTDLVSKGHVDEAKTAITNLGVASHKAAEIFPQYTGAINNANKATAQAPAWVGQYAAALAKSTQAALGAFNAQTQYRSALKAAQEQAKQNSAGIQGHSKAALANRVAIGNLAGSWNNLADSGRGTVKQYESARRKFIETAIQMGVNRERAKQLADRMLSIPNKVRTAFEQPGLQAGERSLARYKSSLAGVPRQIRTVLITEYQRDTTTANRGPINPVTDEDRRRAGIPTNAAGGVTQGEILSIIGDNPGGQEALIPLDKYDIPGKGDMARLMRAASHTDERVLSALREVADSVRRRDGSDDTPERIAEAISDALNKHSDATARRMVQVARSK